MGLNLLKNEKNIYFLSQLCYLNCWGEKKPCMEIKINDIIYTMNLTNRIQIMLSLAQFKGCKIQGSNTEVQDHYCNVTAL